MDQYLHNLFLLRVCGAFSVPRGENANNWHFGPYWVKSAHIGEWGQNLAFLPNFKLSQVFEFLVNFNYSTTEKPILNSTCLVYELYGVCVHTR